MMQFNFTQEKNWQGMVASHKTSMAIYIKNKLNDYEILNSTATHYDT